MASLDDPRAWSDLETQVGSADPWSTYWYNGVAYFNGGLNRHNSGSGASDGNRGFEASRQALDEAGARRRLRDPWRLWAPKPLTTLF